MRHRRVASSRLPAGILACAFLAALAAAGGTVSAPAASAGDTSRPVIVPTVTGRLGTNGWYVGEATVSWSVTDPQSGIKETHGCDTRTISSDTRGTAITCSATNKAGLTGSYTVTIQMDRTPPAVTGAIPARPADRGTWFNHPVAIRFSASDPTSGVAGCRAVRYAGPDSARGKLTGLCVDEAGNVGRARFVIHYDSTPPRVRALLGRRPDRYGWYSHRVTIRFRGRDGTSGVARCTGGTVYRGPNGNPATHAGQCTDRAGNTRRKTVRFRFSHPLLFPAAGTHVRGRVVLRWVEVRRARFYNVQLWHHGKILSRWPHANRLRLHRSWTFAGVRHRLKPGRYTWYVWPRLRHRYGPAIGRSTFVVRR